MLWHEGCGLIHPEYLALYAVLASLPHSDRGGDIGGGRGGLSPLTFIGGGAEPPHQISIVTSYLAHKSKYLAWCGLASRLGATLIWLHGSPSRA